MDEEAKVTISNDFGLIFGGEDNDVSVIGFGKSSWLPIAMNLTMFFAEKILLMQRTQMK